MLRCRRVSWFLCCNSSLCVWTFTVFAPKIKPLKKMFSHLGINSSPFDIKSLHLKLSEGNELFVPKDLNVNLLPKNVDVLAYLYYLRESKSRVAMKSFLPTATKKILSIWTSCNFPTVAYTKAYKKITSLLDSYKDLKIKIHKNCNTVDPRDRIDFCFLKQIFDISKCQCIRKIDPVKAATAFECICDHKNILSNNQLILFNDQVGTRLLTIDTWSERIDTTSTDNNDDTSAILPLEQCMQAMSLSEPPISAERERSPQMNDDSGDISDSEYETETESDDDEDERISNPVKKAIPNTITLPKTINGFNFDGICTEVMRYDMSFRMASDVITRVLEMVGVVDEENKGMVITPSFLQTKIERFSKSLQKKAADENFNRRIRCFFFDGVTSKNGMKIKLDDNTVKLDRSASFENVVVVEQPGDKYIGFISTKNTTASSISSQIITFFDDNSIILDDLVAIGCDGASVNVGADNGIITLIESHIKRPLHRLICILHLLEILLGAIIKYYIGDTKAPNKYKHQVSADLERCEKMEIVQFKPVELNNMPQPIVGENGNEEFDWTRVTGDQKMLLDLSRAVSCGSITQKLSRKAIGQITELRWTIYASRFLRLYMSLDRVPFYVRRVVEFIQTVYVPMLFWIKCYPNWTEAPHHIYRILSFARNINEESFKIVKERITYNSHFLHSENILAAMLTDPNRKLREKACNTILKIRKRDIFYAEQNCGDVPVRTFIKPAHVLMRYSQKQNNEDENYADLLDWTNIESIYEPPITKSLTIERLMHYKNSSDIIEFETFPCHSQGTEFHVQTVKRTVKKYFGYATQDSRIKAKILARNLNLDYKRSHRKGDYKLFELEPKPNEI